MPRRRRRSGGRRPNDAAGDLMRRPAVWLATLSTVVGIATGMFTLRDQVFPGEGSGASAGSLPVYQRDVAAICEDLNDTDEELAHSDRRLATALRHARTAAAQQKALLDSARRSTDRSSHLLATFTGLKAPSSVVTRHRITVEIWTRALERIRDYVQRLDSAVDEHSLRAAVDLLPAIRRKNSRDNVDINANLERLGDGTCQLDTPIFKASVHLPPARSHVGTPKKGVNESSARVSAPDPRADAPSSAVGSEDAPQGGPGPSVNAPASPDASPAKPGPSVNAPAPPDATPTGPGPSVNVPTAPATPSNPSVPPKPDQPSMTNPTSRP